MGDEVVEMDAVIAFLTEHGADTLEHPGGTLLAHLRRTADTLERWGCSADLVLAGLAHATYGTDGFPVPLVPLDERPVVREVLGEAAEAIVYRYCASDRRVTWKELDADPVPFRDRFTDEAGTITGDHLAEYWTLSVANELDLVPTLHGDSILPLLRRRFDLLPEGAVADLS